MIHFGTIEIVELPMVIGDNPSTIGVPITVDWWYPCDIEGDDDHDSDQRHTRTRRGLVQSIPNEYKRILPLDVYEKERSTRRSRKQLHWSRQAREEMLLRQGFTEQEMRLAEFEALIIRRSRRLSQFDREEYEDDGEQDSGDAYSDAFCKERLAISSSSNLFEEASPVKGKISFSRNRNCSALLGSSIPPLSPPPTMLNRACTIWQSGGSPDQPLRGAPKRSSDKSAVGEEVSAALLVEVEEEAEEELLQMQSTTVSSEAGLGTDHHAVLSATVSVSRRSSISSSDTYSSTTSFDRMVSSMPPMQPLVIPARTA